MINLEPVGYAQLVHCLAHHGAHIPREPVCLWGEPGVGKTTLWRDTAHALGMKFTLVHLNQLSPGDVRGLQFPDVKSETSIQYPPDFLPKPNDPPTMVVFDELGSAPELCRKPALELLLERRIGRYELREDDWCVAASNTGDDGALTFDLDRATADRFFHYQVKPDMEAWKRWGRKVGLDPRVLAFISSHDEEFVASGKDREDDVIVPTPRSWEKISQAIFGIDDLSALQPMLSGRLGPQTGSRFAVYCKNAMGHAAAAELVAMPAAKRLAAMPRTEPGLQSLAWSLPVHASNGLNSAKAAFHIAGLILKVRPEKSDSPGEYFAKETAATAAQLLVESCSQALSPEDFESLAIAPEFSKAQELLHIPVEAVDRHRKDGLQEDSGKTSNPLDLLSKGLLRTSGDRGSAS